MNIRNAILKAADHIEVNPGLFRFSRVRVPECGTPGCAIGWIKAFMGVEPGQLINQGPFMPNVSEHVTFYGEMRALVGKEWSSNAEDCARGLRLYADKHYPADKASLDPQFVRFRDSLYREFAMTRRAATSRLAQS